MDRFILYSRWHSLALTIGTRAAGGTQNLQPDTITGSHAIKSIPSRGDLAERLELAGPMHAWLSENQQNAGDLLERMHGAIIAASEAEIQKLLGMIERAEWLVKIKWEGDHHRHYKASEADQNGKEEWERRIIEDNIGTPTREVADSMEATYEAIRWVRRKHGIDQKGEREYPCTVGPLNSCPVCQKLGALAA